MYEYEIGTFYYYTSLVEFYTSIIYKVQHNNSCTNLIQYTLTVEHTEDS